MSEQQLCFGVRNGFRRFMQSMIVLEMVQPKHILKQFPFLRSFVNIWFSQSVALATERVHQKRFYTEQGEIPLLFLRPRGCVYFIFPHIITVVRQSSRGRTFSAVTKKWFYVYHPKIAHDLGIVVPRACAKIKKNRGHSFRARRDDAFCD